MGPEGARVTEICSFGLVIQKQVTALPGESPWSLSPRANKCQNLRGRVIYQLRHSSMFKAGHDEAVGIQTGFLGRSLCLKPSHPDRAALSVPHLTHQQPPPSAFFLTFPPAFLASFLASAPPGHESSVQLEAMAHLILHPLRGPTTQAALTPWPVKHPGPRREFGVHGAPYGGSNKVERRGGNNSIKKGLPF